MTQTTALSFAAYVATRLEHLVLVVPKANGALWALQAPGVEQPISMHMWQYEAIAAAIKLMEDAPEGGSVRVYGVDGKIREERTINRKDPFPPRG